MSSTPIADFFRHSEGELASYRQTEWLMQEMKKQQARDWEAYCRMCQPSSGALEKAFGIK